ncbi:hypothetical protein P170DRAFT_476743 [Aspergillus steynii IBT 23096]|uniref:Uncharacterized protein n=1 Tax=Aspergillus steynii IBT 23096 TaxID=1392250 RepID=A0A2I2G5E0_9EURO|nr:uncharacterized protein P170DRAFT_476743 [Aspergillus steynii IBT 23096]PLB48098.1 hypothetical protein P170DRAFT_476743 [Aspergillus steynii IBT 23096]
MDDLTMEVEGCSAAGLPFGRNKKGSSFHPQEEEIHQEQHDWLGILKHMDQYQSQLWRDVEDRVGDLKCLEHSFSKLMHDKDEKLQQKEHELGKLRRENEKLKSENHDLRRQLSSTVPVSQISDTTIQDEVILIYQTVSDFAEGFPDVANFQMSFAYAAWRLGIENKIYSSFHEFTQASSAKPELLAYITFRYLWKYLFKRLLAMVSTDQNFLRHMQNETRISEATYGMYTSADWQDDRN